jgi:hypothetical protein
MISEASQIELVRALMVHSDVCRDLDGILTASTFEGGNSLGIVAQFALSLYRENQAVATEGQLRDAIESSPLPGSMRSQVHERLDDVLVADAAPTEWCVREGRKLAAEVMVKGLNVDGMAEEGKYLALRNAIEEAMKLVAPAGEVTVGEADLDAIKRRHTVEGISAPIGIAWLDNLLGGGHQQGRFMAWLAEKGGGKSHALVHVGCAALRQGLTVLHVSLEMPDWEVRGRYDRNLSGMSMAEAAANPLGVLECIAPHMGRLYVRDNAAAALTPYGLESILDRMPVQPDVLIVDYAQLMTSGGNFTGSSAARQDANAVAIEMRRIAQRRKLHYHTAYQVNRDGAKKNHKNEGEFIDKTDIAVCYDALWHADIVVSLNQTIEQSVLGKGILYLSDNRGGPCKAFATLNFGWATSRISEGL